MKLRKKIAGVLMAALCITTLSFTGAKTVRADGDVTVAQTQVEAEVLEITSTHTGSDQNVTGKITFKVNKDLSTAGVNLDTFKFKSGEGILGDYTVQAANGNPMGSDYVYEATFTPKKTGFVTLPKSFGTITLTGKVNEKIRVRNNNVVGGSGQERITVEEFKVDDEAPTKKITLKLAKDIPNLELRHLMFETNNHVEITSMASPTSEHEYVFSVNTNSEGKVSLDEILNEKTDYVLAFKDSKATNEVTVKTAPPKKTVNVTLEAVGAENTTQVKIKMNPFEDGLQETDFKFEDHPNVVLSNFQTVQGESCYKFDVTANALGSHKLILKTVENAGKAATHEFVVKNPAGIQVKKTDAIVVSKFEAKKGAPTTELKVEFDKPVTGGQKPTFTFDPANDLAEISEPATSDSKTYTFKIKAKKAGKLKLTAVILENHTFTGLEQPKEVDIKVYDPSEEEEEALLLEKKAEEKKAEEKKAEEKKVEEKKTEEKKAEEKKTEEKTADVVVTTKKSKALNVTVKEDTIKDALEKDTDLVIKNKKQKVEIAPELLKMVHDKFGVFKMTLKPVKEKALFVTGAKHTRAYDFKINNKTMKTAEPVKVTLNYKGAKLPKVYVVGKNGKLTEVKGVKLDKATKTVSFNTKHIKKFVLAY